MTKEDFLKKYNLNLTQKQLSILDNIDTPTLVLAVPGSGKTTVLISRIGYMIFCKNIPPENILTMTYTISATSDMKNRFCSFFGSDLINKLQFRTINGICSLIIRTYEKFNNTKAFDLIDNNFNIPAIIKKIYIKFNNEYPNESTIKDILSAISFCKNMMLDNDKIRDTFDDIQNFPQIYREYESFKISNKVMDYDDQLVYAYKILKSYPAVLNYYENKYKYINVDESQDTSKLQHKIIQLLTAKNQHIFMVGDEDQSIYSFRAAYPQGLMDFKKNYNNANIIFMEENFRSTKEIVNKANNFIRLNKTRYDKNMFTNNNFDGKINLITLKNYQSQISYLKKIAEDCTKETAVLYRFNESAIPLIDLLEKEKIPYKIKEFDPSFFTNYLVIDILKIIKFAFNPYDIDLFSEIYYKMGFIISKASANTLINNYTGKKPILEEYLYSLDDNYHKNNLYELINALNDIKNENSSYVINNVLYRIGYIKYLYQKGNDLSKLRILFSLAKNNPILEDFINRIDFLDKTLRTKKESDSNFILSSIHSSKALEFERVILIDIKDNYFPSIEQNPLDEAKKTILEEERRLFYVAVTRAKKFLDMIVYSKENFKNVEISYFIKDFLKDNSNKNYSLSDFQIGTKINHKIFGNGTITSMSKNIAKIKFENNVDKTLDLSISIKNNLII